MSPAHALDRYYLLLTFLVTVAYQMLGFAIAWTFRFDKITDFTGGSNFFILALMTLLMGGTFCAENLLASVFVMVWAARLAGFLLFRVLKRGSDSRFDEIRGHFFKFLGQIVWVWTVSSPVTIRNSPAVVDFNQSCRTPGYNGLDIAGIVIWALGWSIESTADITKYMWKSSNPPKNAIMRTSVWKWSRHPPYFGEILCWWGIWLLCISPATTHNVPASSRSALYGSIVSPLFTTVLLLFASGIPPAEKSQSSKFYALKQKAQEDPDNNAEGAEAWADYQDYVKSTSVLIMIPNFLYRPLPRFIKQTVLLDFPMYHSFDYEGKKMSATPTPSSEGSCKHGRGPVRKLSQFLKRRKSRKDLARSSESSTEPPPLPPKESIPVIASSFKYPMAHRHHQDRQRQISEPAPTYTHQWEIEMFDYTAPHRLAPAHSASASAAAAAREPPYPYNHPNFPYPNLHHHQPHLPSGHGHNGVGSGTPPPPSSPPPPLPPKKGGADGYSPTLRKQNTRTQPPAPEERARMRQAALRQREADEQRAEREERQRAVRRKQEREAEERALVEAEAARKAALQDELRYAAERKAREEREAREREEARLAEIRARKRAEQERRRKYTLELERWRREQAERAQGQVAEKEALRRRSEEAKRERVMRINEDAARGSSTGEGMCCGWVTMQTPESLAWKRRYFRFDLDKGSVAFYRAPHEMTRPMDTVALDGRVDRICEWWEGFEELEAIPHSFAVKFVDGQDWLMYADTSDEKDKLLMLVSESAGIII
ncbi:DUF1295-domain-containing protein [Coniophora puteana RWD-64-598 SS2]|uniref:DUF1295-domain-containing protein n=1 Tax=Coniophora puteana (strain RWD-64-598) TaxID=741705 RepID=A0A5M3MM20_CONPW|nr:DUF1295-domain-containing protein [Coniophora puteana RWD-64-598 SS2]EIW80218.1 DUF1295-domain-containing protein [Coniophora puteana RWD-64-598 SS2]